MIFSHLVDNSRVLLVFWIWTFIILVYVNGSYFCMVNVIWYVQHFRFLQEIFIFFCDLTLCNLMFVMGSSFCLPWFYFYFLFLRVPNSCPYEKTGFTTILYKNMRVSLYQRWFQGFFYSLSNGSLYVIWNHVTYLIIYNVYCFI